MQDTEKTIHLTMKSPLQILPRLQRQATWKVFLILPGPLSSSECSFPPSKEQATTLICNDARALKMKSAVLPLF